MRNQFFFVLATCFSGQALAAGCEHSRDIDVRLDLAGAERVSISALAGDLEITGNSGANEAVVLGRVCVSEPGWLDQAGVETQPGRNARIDVVMPDQDDGWNVWGNRYAYIDLRVQVPDTIALDVRDSSGNIRIERTGPVELSDSSGDIEIENVRGTVTLSDSSGSIELIDIEGDVIVENDSSGDIYGERILGSVLVKRDSSGDIEFRDVRDSYTVDRDSSGDIIAHSIGGDFRVGRDGSGKIRSSGVAGALDIPDKS